MENTKAPALKLQDEVARQYDLKPGKVIKFYSASLGREVDLSQITLDQAKRYETAGYLVRKGAEKK